MACLQLSIAEVIDKAVLELMLLRATAALLSVSFFLAIGLLGPKQRALQASDCCRLARQTWVRGQGKPGLLSFHTFPSRYHRGGRD